MRGKDILYFSIAGIALYGAYRVFNFGGSVREGVNKLWAGITFDPSTLPPIAQPTASALRSQNEMIRLGYLVIDSNGRSRITPAGEAYIARQRALQ